MISLSNDEKKKIKWKGGERQCKEKSILGKKKNDVNMWILSVYYDQGFYIHL